MFKILGRNVIHCKSNVFIYFAFTYFLHSVPRIVTLTINCTFKYGHTSLSVFTQLKPNFNICALFFSEFPQIKNQVYLWIMQKNYQINFFNYKSHNPWHTQYKSFLKEPSMNKKIEIRVLYKLSNQILVN